MVKDETCQELLKNIFENEDLRYYFSFYPVTMSGHHNYKHGLIKHSVEVAENAVMLVEKYKNKAIDLDVVIVASLLHDIGVLKTMDVDEGSLEISYTDWNELVGVRNMSSLIVSKSLDGGINEEKSMKIYNLILGRDSDEIESIIFKMSNNLSKEVAGG